MAAVRSAAGDSIDAEIGYLSPDSSVNRFFWSPDGRRNTSIIDLQRVTIHNARTAGHAFTLDRHGFALARHPTALADTQDPDAINGLYAREVAAIAQDLTGADLIIPMGAEIRSSALDGRTVQPPAARAHIDYDVLTATHIAQRRYRRAKPDGPLPERFILLSIWRCFSPAPQDWPIALCDYESCKDDREVRVVKINVERLPEGDALYAPIEGEETMGASGLFAYNPAHRWYYYPDMTRDEIIAIKFHDSDHDRAWRAPHCAFHDESRPDARPRESVEFRVAAYFMKK
jgi:hypothetical protein